MKTILSLAILALLSIFLALPAHADSGSGSDVAVSIGSGSAVVSAPTAAALHDPTTDPIGAIGDVKGLKARWPLLVLAVLIGLTKVMTFAGGKLAPLGKWLAVGKRAMLIAAVGGLAAAAFDSLASGGTWMSALLVAGGAVFALMSPHAPPAAQAKAAV